MARKFYLDKAHGKLAGVCAGIADYIGVDVTWVRAAVVLGTIFGGGFLVPAYLVVALVADPMPPAPAVPLRRRDEVRRTLGDLDRRLSAIEAECLSAESSLAREIDALGRGAPAGRR